MDGTIKRLIKDRGFGFLVDNATGTEFFFHRSECLSDFDGMKDGHSVTFEVGDSPKGPRAKQVRLNFR